MFQVLKKTQHMLSNFVNVNYSKCNLTGKGSQNTVQKVAKKIAELNTRKKDGTV